MSFQSRNKYGINSGGIFKMTTNVIPAQAGIQTYMIYEIKIKHSAKHFRIKKFLTYNHFLIIFIEQ